MAYVIARRANSVDDAELIINAVENPDVLLNKLTYATAFYITFREGMMGPYIIWFRVDDAQRDKAGKTLWDMRVFPGVDGPKLDKIFFEERIDQAIKEARGY